MDLCWRITGISGTEKAVLMALANHSDELGLCWPSVFLIANMTCFSDRAVQKSLVSLAQKGVIKTSISPGGKSNRYVINPEPRSPLSLSNSKLDGEPDAPLNGEPRSPRTTFTPNHVHRNGEPRSLNGEPRSPKPLRTVKEPSIVIPNGVSQNAWDDFLKIRKAKRAPLTKTALAGIEREAEKAKISLDEAITMCAERSWQTFRADWLVDKKSGNGFVDQKAAVENRAKNLNLNARPGESWDEFSRRVNSAFQALN